MGTPMMRTFCGICVSIRFEAASDEWRVASAEKSAWPNASALDELFQFSKLLKNRDYGGSTTPN
jgi:hypothetical protein